MSAYSSTATPTLSRYLLQSGVSRLLPDSRTATVCQRAIQSLTQRAHKAAFNGSLSVDKQVHVCTAFDGDKQIYFYDNLARCGSIWLCPVCASVVTEKRRLKLSQAIEKHLENNKVLLFVLRTVPHTKADNLSFQLSNFLKAEGIFKGSRFYSNFSRSINLLGVVRALEVTHSLNGWHTHTHELWFVDQTIPTIKQRQFHLSVLYNLFPLWQKACVDVGFSPPRFELGFNVVNGDFMGGYLAKHGCLPSDNFWTVDLEMSKIHLKQAKKAVDKTSFSPFELLRNFVVSGDITSGDLFKEFHQNFKGRHQLQWSRGLKSHFDVSDDSIDSPYSLKDSRCLFKMSTDQWSKVLQHNARGSLLSSLDSGGLSSANKMLSILH